MRIHLSIAILVLLLPATVHAQSSAQAEQLFKQGKDLMKQKKFAEACTAFEASQKLEAAVTTEMNLADCREQNGQIATAYGIWIDVARVTREDPKQKALLKTAKDRSTRLEKDLSYLIINVPDDSKVDGLSITLNGVDVDPLTWNSSLPEDGGDYVVQGKAPAHEPWSTNVHIAARGDKQSVDVPKFKTLPPPDLGHTEPPPPPDGDHHDALPPPVVHDTPSGMSGKRKLSIGLGVVGVAGLAVGVIFELGAESTNSDAAREPDNVKQQQLFDHANNQRAIAIGAGIVGVASASAAVYLWIKGGPHEQPAAHALVPTVGGGQVGMAWVGRFLAIAALALPACDLYIAPDVGADAGVLPPDWCGDPPPCMPTDRGATVCGRLVDLADARLVGANVTIGFEDMSGDGEGVSDTRIDQCGYFSARGIDVPASNEVAMFVDDPDATGYLVTARRLSVGSGSLDNGVEALALRTQVDAGWRNATNVAFTERGALLATFRYQGAPVFGVSVGDVPTYAFSGDQTTRTSVVSSPTSGADGSLLIVPDGTASYQPVGGLPSGCEWPAITPGWWTGVLWTIDVDAICRV